MLDLGSARLMCEDARDLPDLRDFNTLYLDVETSGLDPYKGDEVVGFAVTVDDLPNAWYVPFRHVDGKNVEPEGALAFMRDLMDRAKLWVNHNIKFDAHFCAVEGAEFKGPMHCTYALSRVHDTDRRTYKLKPLVREYCGIPMAEEERVDAYLKGIKAKDGHRQVPSDMEATYACDDVLGNRALYKYLDDNRPEQLDDTWNMENDLTPVLFDMERFGMRVDVKRVKTESVKTLRKLIALADELHELTGFEFTDSNKHLFNILIVQLGLPIVMPGKKGGVASFDKEALAMYRVHPRVTTDPKINRIVEAIVEYRRESQYFGLYLEPYAELCDDEGILHPSYNQMVRTGRMSGSHPNPQQLNKAAKALIEPRPGNALMRSDASQIEFRLIVHYTKDDAAIEAYATNPLTDYHRWVADVCEVTRDDGKTLNFAMAYGAGKRRVTRGLSQSEEIMRIVQAELEDFDGDKAKEFTRRCMMRGADVYDRYHERLPGIKATSYAMERVAKLRGFVFNCYGRRRHLPVKFAHKAFNSVIQSAAMDYTKRKLISLSPRHNEVVRQAGLEVMISVHDEIVWEGPRDSVYDPDVQRHVLTELERSDIELRVPIVWDMGISDASWAEAGADEALVAREALGL